MSSFSNRGATGANKHKLQNVNSIYAGKNTSLGGKTLGRNGGLTSVGKACGVVRRMPPPATLPSLRAESQGQDPDVALVPQGGTGWSTTESSAQQAHTAPVSAASDSKGLPTVASSSGVDLRPTWAKPVSAPSTDQTATVQSTGGSRDFPSLAASVGGTTKDALKPQKTWRSSGSTSEEPLSELPARFYDGGNTAAPRPYAPARFQGSSDARASQGYAMESRRAGDTNGTTGNPDYGRDVHLTDRISLNDRSDYGRREEEVHDKKPMPLMSVETHAPEGMEERRADRMREAAIDKSRQKRMNGNEESFSYNGVASRRLHQEDKPSMPQPEYRLLKRSSSGEEHVVPRFTPSTVANLNRAVEEEEDEELCMTKLSKAGTRVVKRVAPGIQESQREMDVNEEKKETREKTTTKSSSSYDKGSIKEERKAPSPPPPPPAENIWEKRKEERASAEREKSVKPPRALEQTLQQHFPSVAEAASIRIDKESNHKPDTDLTRTAMKARRGHVVNDVRALQDGGEERNNRPRPQKGASLLERNAEGRRDHHREYDERERYDRGTGDWRDREYRDYERYERQPQKEWNGGEEEEEYRGGPREYVNSRAGGRGRGGMGGRMQRGGGQMQRGGRIGQRGERTERTRDWREEEEKKDEQEGYEEERRNEGEGEKRNEKMTEERKEEKSQTPSQQEDDNVERTKEFPQRTSMRGRGRGRGQGERRQRIPREEREKNEKGQGDRRRREGQGDNTSDGGNRHIEQRGRPTRGLYAPRGARKGHERREGGRGGRAATEERSVEEGRKEEENEEGRGERETRLKSPVVSSEGHDEWETASESSQREEGERKNRIEVKRQEKGVNGDEVPPRQRLPKNGQPASRTYHVHSEQKRKEKRKEEESEEEIVDRLAGLDLADGRVVVIDNHPPTHDGHEGNGDFEEVLSKKQKKARAEEEKAKKEADERKAQKEKERIERMNARRQQRQQSKVVKEEKRKTEDKDDKKEDSLITTVWNSAQPEARAALEGGELAIVTCITDAPVLPSPIARPKGNKKSSPVEILGASKGDRVKGEEYEFIYDEGAVVEEKEEVEEEDSDERATIAPSETGSAATTDDQQKLKENLSLCKNLWGREDTSSLPVSTSSSSLPTNVAKVKPQPQNGCSLGGEDGRNASPRPPSRTSKPSHHTMTNECGGGLNVGRSHTMAPRSPAINSVFNPLPNYGFGNLTTFLHDASFNAIGTTLPPACSPPSMHSGGGPSGGYSGGTRVGGVPHSMHTQRNNYEHNPLFMHANTRGSGMGNGWNGGTLENLVPSSTPPPPPSIHSHQPMMSHETMSGMRQGGPSPFSCIQSQQPRYNAPPPSQQMNKNASHMPPLYPTCHMMNLPPPSLGAVGDRSRGGPPHSNSFHHSGGSFPTMPPPHTGPSHFSGPPPPFTRPPPQMGELWKTGGVSGPPPLNHHNSGHNVFSYGHNGGSNAPSQMGGINRGAMTRIGGNQSMGGHCEQIWMPPGPSFVSNGHHGGGGQRKNHMGGRPEMWNSPSNM